MDIEDILFLGYPYIKNLTENEKENDLWMNY